MFFFFLEKTLFATVPVDTGTFSLWLHQNCPNFCNEIEEVEAALDVLGDADLLKTDDDFVSAEGVLACKGRKITD